MSLSITSILRIVIPLAVALALSAAPFGAEAGSLGAPACEVVAIMSAELRPYQETLRGFRRTSACEVREVRADDDAGLDDIARNPPDIVVAIGTKAYRKARLLEEIKVLYLMTTSNEVDQAPASSISGIRMDIAPSSYLAAVRDIFPAVKRIGLLYDPRQTRLLIEEAIRAAKLTGIELTAKPVHGPSDVPPALSGMPANIDLFWMLPDPTITSDVVIDQLLRFGIQRNIPIATFSKKYLELGSAVTLDIDPYDMGAQAAELASRLLNSGKGPLVEYARKAKLQCNSTVIKKLGVPFRDDLCRKAGTRD